MLNDERVLIRRENLTLGDDTIVVDGKRVKRGHIDFSVSCNVQPVSGEELMQMPEGDRFNEMTFMWVADQERPLQVNDLVFRPDDGWYQIQGCEGWGSYTKARMARVDTGRYRSDITGINPTQIPIDAQLLLSN